MFGWRIESGVPHPCTGVDNLHFQSSWKLWLVAVALKVLSPETHAHVKQQEFHVLNPVNVWQVITVTTLTQNIRIITLMGRKRKLRVIKNNYTLINLNISWNHIIIV